MLLLSLSRPLTFPKAVRILLPIVSLCILFPSVLQAAEWSLKGSLDQSLGYDDNVRMLSKDSLFPGSRGSFKYRIIPVLTFLHKTEVSEIQADASYGTQIYTDIPQFDQDIQNYSLSGLYKTARFDWGLSTNLSVTPARNTAALNSGDFNTNSDRTSWSVSPSVSYKIDELNSIILSPSYSETSFTSSGSSPTNSTNFRNNTSTNIGLAWQRLWNERYTSNVNFFYSNFSSPRTTAIGESTFDSVGINFSNTYVWSQNWNIDGTVGARHTQSTIGTVSNGSFGFLANVGINYTGESFSSGISFNRSLTPSNQGQLQEQTGASLHFRYKIAERLSAGLTTSYTQSTSVNEPGLVNGINQLSTRKRENIVVEPSVSWSLSPDWTLAGSYRYRTQQGGLTGEDNITNDVNGVAESNLFILSINYNWQGLKLSR